MFDYHLSDKASFVYINSMNTRINEYAYKSLVYI